MNTTEERYKRIENHPNYFITTKGNVFSQPAGKDTFHPLKAYRGGSNCPESPKGKYHVVCLYNNGKKTRRYVHQLVLEAFYGAKPPGMQTLHNNGIRSDNRLENLSWGTAKENAQDRIRHQENK